MRLINADQFILAIMDASLSSVDEDTILDLVDSVPTVDAVPVVHGELIHHDDGVDTCSECGNAESSDSYYCRYCGAKMDGGAE